LQKIRPADIDDVVLVDVDRGSVTTQYDDLELLPDDIVSLSAKGHLFGMFKKNMFVVGDMLVVAEFILLQAVYTFLAWYHLILIQTMCSNHLVKYRQLFVTVQGEAK